jgi:hypothetical protein
VNDALLMAAFAKLRCLLEADHVPKGVKLALPRLSECQTKLFCTHFHGSGTSATGATDGGIGFEPSNFLKELLTAADAFDWPKVLILVHDALPEAEDQHTPANAVLHTDAG